jgi:hypothetical protein
MATKNLLFMLTQHIDRSQTECDGASRLVHLALTIACIPHTVMCGYLYHHGLAMVPFHFWFKCGDFVIDYRARMWYGPEAPHGVFETHEYPSFSYAGEPTTFDIRSCQMVAAMESMNEYAKGI